MSRRHSAEKRPILPDAKYGDMVLTKFMNNLMYDGKKSVAENIVYGALEKVEEKIKRQPVEVFREALDNIKPSVEVRSRRVGGATYQVPVEVRPERREALAIRWLIGASRSRNEKHTHWLRACSRRACSHHTHAPPRPRCATAPATRSRRRTCPAAPSLCCCTHRTSAPTW